MNTISVSNGLSVVQIKLLLSDGSTQDFLSDNIQLDSAVFVDRLDGFSEYVYSLRASTDTYVNNLLKEAFGSGDPTIQVRVGVGTPGGTTTWLPWQTHTVHRYGAALFGQTGSTGYLTKMFSRDKLWNWSRYNKITVRKGTVSGIVESIANTYGIGTVIETTGGSLTPLTFVQSSMSDDKFIRERMIPRAVNQNGRGGYRLFVKDDKLHFHTLDYQANTLSLVYYTGGAIQLSHADRSQKLIEMGASGVRYLAHDPYTGDTKEFLSDPESSLKLATSAPLTYDVIGAQRNIQWHVGVNGPDEVAAMANAKYDTVKSHAFAIKVKMPQSIDARVGDFVQLSITNDGTNAPWSGLYYIGTTARSLVKSSMMTEMVLFRGEYEDDTNNFNGLANSDPSVVTSNTSSPGQSPNLAQSTDELDTNDPENAILS